MRLFDRKFGARFLDEVPAAPGVYRFHDAAGVLFYVGPGRRTCAGGSGSIASPGAARRSASAARS